MSETLRGRSSDQPEKLKTGLTRRDFVKRSFVAAGVLAAPPLLKEVIWERYKYKIMEDLLPLCLSKETQQMISEIRQYREALGLSGLPKELIPGIMDNVKWEDEPEAFDDAVPEKNRSYSMRIYEVLQKLFGDNCLRNVRGCAPDPGHPFGMSFDYVKRYCMVSDAVHNIPLTTQFLEYILHEAIGHGFDPAIEAKFPSEILTKVEHGKWRALSQALTIPGEFFNNRGDLTLPLVKRKIGETVGLGVMGEERDELVSREHATKYDEEIGRIVTKRYRDRKTIKFNKAVCKEIGEVMVGKLLRGEIKFAGKLKETYQDSIEVACLEIYAEMFKYALLYPEKIGNNTEVIGGVMEVFDAVSGQNDLVALRESIRQPSGEILLRHGVEKSLLQPEVVSIQAKVSSSEELERIRAQRVEFERLEMQFKRFGSEGEVPVALESTGEIVHKFAKLYSKIVKKYPVFGETSAQKYDESFDPEMHIWEIRKVEAAMDSGFVRNLTGSSSVSEGIIDEMKSKTEVLEGFVQSEAF